MITKTGFLLAAAILLGAGGIAADPNAASQLPAGTEFGLSEILVISLVLLFFVLVSAAASVFAYAFIAREYGEDAAKDALRAGINQCDAFWPYPDQWS